MGTLLSLLNPPNPAPCETTEVGVVSSCDRPTTSSGVFVLVDWGHLQLWDAINNELLWDVNWAYGSILYYLPARHIVISSDCRELTGIQITELDSGDILTVQGVGGYTLFKPSHDGSKFLMDNYGVTSLWRHDNGLHEIPMSWNCQYGNTHFADDDACIITIATDATVCVWNIDTRETILSFTGLSDRGHVDTHRNLFAMCYEADAKVWDLTTGKIMRSFTARRDTSAICINLDLIIIAEGTYAIDDSLVCWNLADGTELFSTRAGAIYTHQIVWSPAIGGFCTFSLTDRKVRHYSLSGQPLSCISTFGKKHASVGLFVAPPQEVILL
jgi:WD40 repeat protein